MIGLVTVAPAKMKGRSPTLLLISGFTARVIKLSLLTEGLNDERVAEFLVLEATEHRGRGLFVEVQLRHRLVARDFNLGLLLSAVTTRGLARNSASASSLSDRMVTDICGTERMANWPASALRRSGPNKKSVPVSLPVSGSNLNWGGVPGTVVTSVWVYRVVGGPAGLAARITE